MSSRSFQLISFNGVPLLVIFRAETEERLKTTCFREKRALAGNFCLWSSFAELMAEPAIVGEFTRAIDDEIDTVGVQHVTSRLKVIHHEVVGWSSTIDSELVQTREMEKFSPNNRTRAWRMKDRTAVAPKTHTVTFIVEMCPKGDYWLIIVRSLYPGPDVGPLRGYMGHCVFFDWSNPGDTEGDLIQD